MQTVCALCLCAILPVGQGACSSWMFNKRIDVAKTMRSNSATNAQRPEPRTAAMSDSNAPAAKKEATASILRSAQDNQGMSLMTPMIQGTRDKAILIHPRIQDDLVSTKTYSLTVLHVADLLREALQQVELSLPPVKASRPDPQLSGRVRHTFTRPHALDRVAPKLPGISLPQQV